MKIKFIKNGFGKKNIKLFKLNQKAWCINLMGIAIFITL